MTFAQLYRRFLQKVDKSAIGSSFQPREVDDLLNEAVATSVDSWALGVENNARMRLALGRITAKPFTGTGNVILLKTVPGFSRLLEVAGSWDNDTNGNPVWTPLVPVQQETRSRRSRSWIHAPTDSVPGYVEYTGDSGLAYEIQSESNPGSWRVSYLKAPQVVNGWTSGNTEWTDFPVFAENLIINYARRLAAEQLGDAANFQLSQAETN